MLLYIKNFLLKNRKVVMHCLGCFVIAPLLLEYSLPAIFLPSLTQFLKKKQHPVIVAHRGDSQCFPENTIEAYDGAVANGAQMIELDVFLTKDGHLVILHDDLLDRTTNGSGKVWQYSLEELRCLDAGSWFSKYYMGSKIPILEEILKRYAHKVYINIEIKYERGGEAQGYFIEKSVVDLVKKLGLLHRVIISSFDLQILRRVRILSKKANIGVLSEEDESPIDLNVNSRQ